MKKRWSSRFARALSMSTILCSGLLLLPEVVCAQADADAALGGSSETSEEQGASVITILTSQSGRVDTATFNAATIKQSGTVAHKVATDTSVSAAVTTLELEEGAVLAARYLNPDQNGVDPVDGSFNMAIDEGGIGSGEGRLALMRHYGRSGWTYNMPARLDKKTVGGATYVTFALSGVQKRFDWNGAAYFPQNGDGSTLVESSDHKTFTYTDRDGTKLEFYYPSGTAFDDPIMRFCSPSVTTNCSSIPGRQTQPNNLVTEYSWTIARLCFTSAGYCQNFDRMYRITNSTGRAISFSYAYDFVNGEQNPSTQKQRDYFKATSTTFSDGAANSTVTRTFGATASEPASITLADGRTYAFTYTSVIGSVAHPIASVKLPGEQVVGTTISYDTNGVSSITRQGVTTNYVRTVSGATANTVVSGGYSATFQGDIGKSRITKITDAAGGVTTLDVTDEGRVTSVTFPELNAIAYQYDPRGNVLKTTATPKPNSGLAAVVTMAAYPATCTVVATCNLPTWTRDPRQSAIYGTAQDNPLNQTDYTYYPTGQVASVRLAPDINGVRPVTTYSYQQISTPQFGAVNMLQAIYRCRTTPNCSEGSDERVDAINYDSKLQVIEASFRDGSDAASNFFRRSYSYNWRGQVTSIYTPAWPAKGVAQNIHQSIDYDNLGRVSRIQAGGAIQFLSYDTVGRLNTTQVGYEGNDSVIYEATATTSYDQYGRKTAYAFATSAGVRNVVNYSYDTLGRLSCIAQRLHGEAGQACAQDSYQDSRITRYGYDALNRVKEVEAGYLTADARVEQNSYTLNGRIASVADGLGHITSYTYDGLDRLNRTTYPSGSNDYEQLAYDANGNVVSRRLRNGLSIGFQYDNLDRLVFKDLPSSTGEQDVSYTYDLHGNLLTATGSQTGQTITFSYDAVDRLRGEQSPWYSYTYAYNTENLLSRVRHGDGLEIDYDYDAGLRVSRIRENGATSGVGLLASFTYDVYGQLTTMTRGNGTVTHYQPDFGRLAQFSHDLVGTSGDLSRSFTYNGADQIATATSSTRTYSWTGGANLTRGYAINSLNQYTQAGDTTFLYDQLGNLVRSGTALGGYDYYSYDSEGRMVSALGKQLTYDPLGRLHQVAGSSQFVMQADGTLLAELDSNNALLRRYVFAPGMDRPILRYEGAGTSDRRWLHADERGSIIAVTDASGAAIASANYDEYGIPGGGDVGRFGYTAQLWLPEIGLHYYKARMYSPTLGRFMQADPIGYANGRNWYNYTGGDPVNYLDPSGLSFCALMWLNGTSPSAMARDDFARCSGKGKDERGDVPDPPSSGGDGTAGGDASGEPAPQNKPIPSKPCPAPQGINERNYRIPPGYTSAGQQGDRFVRDRNGAIQMNPNYAAARANAQGVNKAGVFWDLATIVFGSVTGGLFGDGVGVAEAATTAVGGATTATGSELSKSDGC